MSGHYEQRLEAIAEALSVAYAYCIMFICVTGSWILHFGTKCVRFQFYLTYAWKPDVEDRVYFMIHRLGDDEQCPWRNE